MQKAKTDRYSRVKMQSACENVGALHNGEGGRAFVKTTENILLALRYDADAGELVLLDQRALPLEETYIRYNTVEGVHDAIADMVVRGAPAIGVAAAYGMLFAARTASDTHFLEDVTARATHLENARPTAVNLSWAVRRMLACAREHTVSGKAAACEVMERVAIAIHAEDAESCRRIGEALLPRLFDGMGILTHCNAGQLATSRYGTALSPIYLGMERGMRFNVYSDETRPRLQGSMLTAYELQAAGCDVTVLCDNMAAMVMAQGKIDCCIVGADRIARNGDTANKIGTYGVAVLAHHFGIPFYVAAPWSTIDLDCADGAHIPIEERHASEVTERFGQQTAPSGVRVYNPSFDVTPHDLITAIITEKGVYTGKA